MDAILSVRISDELKQKFNELAQSEGINNKELMEQVVKYYELNRTREIDSNMSEDIKELQTITTRMADIYINIVERNNIKTLEVRNVHRNELIDKDKEFQKLKEKISLLKEENKKIIILQKEQSNANHASKELKESIDSLKALNNMQGEKILKLKNDTEKYIKYKDENLKIKTDIDKLTNKNMQLNNMLVNQNEKNNKLVKNIDELDKSNKNKINELQMNAKQDIEMQKERSSFEADKVLLNLREQQQSKLQEIQETFNDRINKLFKEKENEAEKFRNTILKIDKLGTKDIAIEKK